MHVAFAKLLRQLVRASNTGIQNKTKPGHWAFWSQHCRFVDDGLPTAWSLPSSLYLTIRPIRHTTITVYARILAGDESQWRTSTRDRCVDNARVSTSSQRQLCVLCAWLCCTQTGALSDNLTALHGPRVGLVLSYNNWLDRLLLLYRNSHSTVWSFLRAWERLPRIFPRIPVGLLTYEWSMLCTARSERAVMLNVEFTLVVWHDPHISWPPKV